MSTRNAPSPEVIASRVAVALIDGVTRSNWSVDAPLVALTHRERGSGLVVTVTPNERHLDSSAISVDDLWAALESSGEAAAAFFYSLAGDPEAATSFEGALSSSALLDALSPRPRGEERARKRATLWLAMNLLDALIVREDREGSAEIRPFTITTVTRHRRHPLPVEVGFRVALGPPADGPLGRGASPVP